MRPSSWRTRILVDWFDAKGFDVDIITDHDLHREGVDLLEPYDVVLTGTHPEYTSVQMLDALEAYLTGGGRLMYMGGNGFYWITSLDPTGWFVEVRREHGTEHCWQGAPGETYHATTEEFGGLWRFRGQAPQRLVGVGFSAQGFDRNSPFRRMPGSFDPRAAFIFEGLDENALIGEHSSLVLDVGTAGSELDRVDYALGSPAHTLVLARSFGHSDAYQHVVEEVRRPPVWLGRRTWSARARAPPAFDALGAGGPASPRRRVINDNYFCRRIASPDLLPGEHRCLRIPATEGRHDVDDQSGSTTGVGGGGGRAVSAEHGGREGSDPGRVRCAHRVPPQARHPSPERRPGNAASAARTPVRVRRGRDRGVGRAVGGIGPRVREAPEGVAADPGAGTRAARAPDPGPAGARAAHGGERRHDRPPPGVGAGCDGRSAPAPSFRERPRAGQGSGAHLRRLAGSGSGLRRGRPGRALRVVDGRQLRLDAGADRYRQRLDGMRSVGFAARCRFRCRGSTPTTAASSSTKC